MALSLLFFSGWNFVSGADGSRILDEFRQSIKSEFFPVKIKKKIV